MLKKGPPLISKGTPEAGKGPVPLGRHRAIEGPGLQAGRSIVSTTLSARAAQPVRDRGGQPLSRSREHCSRLSAVRLSRLPRICACSLGRSFPCGRPQLEPSCLSACASNLRLSETISRLSQVAFSIEAMQRPTTRLIRACSSTFCWNALNASNSPTARSLQQAGAQSGLSATGACWHGAAAGDENQHISFAAVPIVDRRGKQLSPDKVRQTAYDRYIQRIFAVLAAHMSAMSGFRSGVRVSAGAGIAATTARLNLSPCPDALPLYAIERRLVCTACRAFGQLGIPISLGGYNRLTLTGAHPAVLIVEALCP